MAQAARPYLRLCPAFRRNSSLTRVRGEKFDLACSVLLLLLLILCPTLTAIAQETQTISVREALRDADGDYIPDRLGKTVTLTGVLTTDPLVLGSPACPVNLQDDTGGIVLFTPDTTLLVGQFNRGDLVKVRGKIGQYKGLEQLVIAEIQRL